MFPTNERDDDRQQGDGSELRELTPNFRSVATTGPSRLTTPNFPSSNVTRMKIGERNNPHELGHFDNTKSGNIDLPIAAVGWPLGEAPGVPSYPIDRFSIDVPTRPNVVAARCSESLRLRSIVAFYEGATAICRTSSFLKFAIYLYAHDDGESTIVEVVRHRGDGYKFRIERDLIQKAARGFGAQPNTELPCILKIPEDFLKNYKGPTVKDHEKLLERSTERLHTDCPDDKLFVLENLCTNTASDKVNYDSSLQLSRLVLDNHSDIFNLIYIMMVEFHRKSDDLSYQVVSACLGTVANCMNNLAENDILKEHLESNVHIDQFTRELIKIIEECKCAHNTASALICFRLILTCSKAGSDTIDEMGNVKGIVEKALSNGQQFHYNLEKAAESTLQVLSH